MQLYLKTIMQALTKHPRNVEEINIASSENTINPEVIIISVQVPQINGAKLIFF